MDTMQRKESYHLQFQVLVMYVRTSVVREPLSGRVNVKGVRDDVITSETEKHNRQDI